MELRISRRHHRQLLEWAIDADSEECCGLILGQGDNVTQLLLADNVALQPSTHFEIDHAKLIDAEKGARTAGPTILGYFHSHPNGLAQPSPTDAEMAATDGRYWLIITSNAVTAWKAVTNGSLHRRFDPVSLIISNAQG